MPLICSPYEESIHDKSKWKYSSSYDPEDQISGHEGISASVVDESVGGDDDDVQLVVDESDNMND